MKFRLYDIRSIRLLFVFDFILLVIITSCGIAFPPFFNISTYIFGSLLLICILTQVGLYLFPRGYVLFDEKGIEFISEALSDILSNTCKTTTIVLETMSGKGTEVGSTFDELSSIIKNSNSSSNLGVCFDTCHMFDAGFDFDKIDLILEEFDKKIGIDKLKLIHLNDSKNPIGSKKDRHECIGKGFIGMDVFKKIINHEYLKNLPFILETPNDLIGYAEEIFTLKKMT